MAERVTRVIKTQIWTIQYMLQVLEVEWSIAEKMNDILEINQ